MEDGLRILVSGVRKGHHLSIDTTATIIRIDDVKCEPALRFNNLSAEDLNVLEALIAGHRISA